MLYRGCGSTWIDVSRRVNHGSTTIDVDRRGSTRRSRIDLDRREIAVILLKIVPNVGSCDLGHVTQKLKIYNIFLHHSNNGVISFQMISGFSVLSIYFNNKFLSPLGIFGCFDVRVTSDSDVGSWLDFG